MLISRYSLSNRQYIEIIADIFRVMVDIFEKSLIYLARNPPGYLG
ncbi:PadR family transcriptional regulator [Bacillus pacificus]|nr:PadR family transcriptional regulator [Bacillus pacificus]